MVDFSYIEKKFAELFIATVGELVNVRIVPVYKAGGKQKNLHAQSAGYHVLLNVVANHYAFLTLKAKLLKYVTVIVCIRLAVTGIFVGGYKVKILRLHAGPTYAPSGGRGWENGVCGKYYTQAPVLKAADYFGRFRRKTAGAFYLIKLLFIEPVKKGLVFYNLFCLYHQNFYKYYYTNNYSYKYTPIDCHLVLKLIL